MLKRLKGNFTRRINWMLYPGRALADLQGAAPGISWLVVFLSGILLMQSWADLVNLGDRYPVGAILSGSLILGPLAGLILVVGASLFWNVFHNLSSPGSVPPAAEGHGLKARLQRWGRMLAGGERSLGFFQGLTSQAMFYLVLMGLPILILRMQLEGEEFTSAGLGPESGLSSATAAVLYALQGLLFVGFVLACMRLLAASLRRPALVALGLTLAGLLLGISAALALLAGVFHVPLF